MTDLSVPADLTRDEARRLTDEIKDDVAGLLPKIREAFERRADLALGYANWSIYCDAELRGLRLPVGDRREAVAELRGAGMSTRAIGSALGVHHSTVEGDLKSTGGNPPVQPERITSLDGRERPAAMPPRPAQGPSASAERRTSASEPDPVAQVAEAIERHLPPDLDEPHREWRRQFLAALGAGRRAMQFDVDSVASRADDECVDELRRLAADITSYVTRVVASRPKSDNVRRLKAV